MAEQSSGAVLTMEGTDDDPHYGQGFFELQVLSTEPSDADPLLEAANGKPQSGETNPALDETAQLLKKSKDKDCLIEVDVETTMQRGGADGVIKAADVKSKTTKANMASGEKDPLLVEDKDYSGKVAPEGDMTTAEQPDRAEGIMNTTSAADMKSNSKKDLLPSKTTKAIMASGEKVPLLLLDKGVAGKDTIEMTEEQPGGAVDDNLEESSMEVKLAGYTGRTRKKGGDDFDKDAVELQVMPPSHPSPAHKGVVHGIDVTPCSICGKRIPPYGSDHERFKPNYDITHITTMFVDPVTKRYLHEPVPSEDESESTPQVVHLCNRCMRVAECNKMVFLPDGAASDDTENEEGSKKYLWKASMNVIAASSAFAEGIKDTRHLSLELDRKLPPRRVTACDMTFDRTEVKRLLAIGLDFDRTVPTIAGSKGMTFDETVPEILLETSIDINDTSPIIALAMDMTFDKTAPQIRLETALDFDHTEPTTAGAKDMTFDETIPEILLETGVEFDKTQPIMELTIDMSFNKMKPQILLETGVDFDKTEPIMELTKSMTFDKTEPKILFAEGAKVDKTVPRRSLVLDMSYDKTEPTFVGSHGVSVDRTTSLTSLSDSISLDKTTPKTFLELGLNVDKTQPTSSLALGLTVDKTVPKNTSVIGISLVNVPTKTNLVQSLEVDTTAATMSWAKSLSIDRTPPKPAEISITIDKTPPKMYGMLRSGLN